MDPAIAALIGQGLQTALALYIASAQLSGKTEEEIKKDFDDILAKVMSFDPNTIKDV